MKSECPIKWKWVLTAIALLALFGLSYSKASGDIIDSMSLNTNFDCAAPTVVLTGGANQTSMIYANGTSAKVSIDANSTVLTYNYSLNIEDDNASLWEITMEYYNFSNVAKVNAMIVLHDNSTSSQQILMNGGNISQTGNYFNLTSNGRIHLGVMNLVENSAGTATMHAYLRIRVPGTTTYTLYIITFEFT